MPKTLRGIHPSNCPSGNSHSFVTAELDLVFFFCLHPPLVFYGFISAACVTYSGNRGLAIITVGEESFFY